jgi:hypothetical protein
MTACGLARLVSRRADVKPVAPIRAYGPSVAWLVKKHPSDPAPGQSTCAGNRVAPDPGGTASHGRLGPKVLSGAYYVTNRALRRADARTGRTAHTAGTLSPARDGRRPGRGGSPPSARSRQHRRRRERPRGAPVVLRGARSRNGSGADRRPTRSRPAPCSEPTLPGPPGAG